MHHIYLIKQRPAPQ